MTIAFLDADDGPLVQSYLAQPIEAGSQGRGVGLKAFEFVIAVSCLESIADVISTEESQLNILQGVQDADGDLLASTAGIHGLS